MKKILTLLLAAMMVFTLTACGNVEALPTAKAMLHRHHD